jgi:hypothetical protein
MEQHILKLSFNMEGATQNESQFNEALKSILRFNEQNVFLNPVGRLNY